MPPGFVPIPDWFSWTNQGGGVAVTDLNGNGRPDLIVFMIDDGPQQNRGVSRIGHDLDANGNVTGGWSSLLGVNNWFSWENQDADVAVADLGAGPELIILMIDNPPGLNQGYLTQLPLTETPAIHGTWQVLPFDSQVLAVHAALLPTGKVLVFAGSGNNTARVADPTFGDVANGMYTSVVWDPAAPQGNNFAHPATLHRADGKPFDFFCGGDDLLADGRVLSAGGNQAYNHDNNLGQREVATFDPNTEQWTMRAPMAHGRWYPTLMSLTGGRVLAVSGKNETNGDLNPLFEVYDPQADQWHQLPHPQDNSFVGLPFYAHLFLLADNRVFFSGGRMDDGRPQQPGILDLTRQPVAFQPVNAVENAALRNQSSSVLLPPSQRQQVMIIGGGPQDDSTSATGSAEIVDLTQPAPAYRPAMPLSLPRIHLNTVLLPDRTVFVSGGAIIHEAEGVVPIPRLQSEIYDPVTDTWRPGAVASVIRMYHSVALLLPDGSVMTASGNPPPYGQRPTWQPHQPNEELTIELYRPPYLFSGARPTLGVVPMEWHYGQALALPTPQAGHLRWAQLIRGGVTTHAFDCSQRLVDLPIIAQGGGNIQIQVPANPALAPPGWYMLTIVDNKTTPSVATWIHLT